MYLLNYLLITFLFFFVEAIPAPKCPINYQESRERCEHAIIINDRICCPFCKEGYSLREHRPFTQLPPPCYAITFQRPTALSCCPTCTKPNTYSSFYPGDSHICQAMITGGYCCRPRCLEPYTYLTSYPGNSHICKGLFNGGYCCKAKCDKPSTYYDRYPGLPYICQAMRSGGYCCNRQEIIGINDDRERSI